MWIFTKYGFFSAVNARTGDGSKRNPPDPTQVMIRVRDISHAERLQSFISEHCAITGIATPEIITSTNTDYRARMFMATTDWAQVLSALVTDMDYDNFKNATRAEQGATDYEHALHSVWSTMYRTQEKAHGPGIY